jgi:MSHA pilin protein MshC
MQEWHDRAGKPGLPAFCLCAPETMKNDSAGFTLVELVVTMLVVGILAVAVAPRFLGSHGFEERGFYDETIAALRYAQKSAIAQRRLVCAAFTDKTVTLTIASANPAAACNTSLSGPDGSSPYTVDATVVRKYGTADVKFSSYPATLSFEPLGKPSAGASIQVNGFAQAITVDAETGYVY